MNNEDLSYSDLEQYCRDKILILFGVSINAAEAINMITDSITIGYICDNDHKKWDKQFMGLRVNSPQNLAEENPAHLAVIITNRSETAKADIASQLRQLGINNIFYHDRLVQMENLQRVAWRVRHKIVGKEFHIDAEDQVTLDKISTLQELLEEDPLSKDYLSFVLSARMERESLDWKFILNSPGAGVPKYFSHELFQTIGEKEIILCGGLGNAEDFRHFYRIMGSRLIKAYGFEADGGSYAYTEVDMKETKITDYRDKSRVSGR